MERMEPFELERSAIAGWANDAAPGDEVIYGEWRRDVFVPITRMAVKRVTKTRVVASSTYGGDSAHRRDNGYLIIDRRSVYRDRAIVPANHPAVIAARTGGAQP